MSWLQPDSSNLHHIALPPSNIPQNFVIVLRNSTLLLLGKIKHTIPLIKASANAGDEGLIPGAERFPREGNGNSLQYSCLGNPIGIGAWHATVYEFARVRYGLETK